jgi:hypothetical protein
MKFIYLAVKLSVDNADVRREVVVDCCCEMDNETALLELETLAAAAVAFVDP